MLRVRNNTKSRSDEIPSFVFPHDFHKEWLTKYENKIKEINPHPLTKGHFYDCLSILVSRFNKFPQLSFDCLIVWLYSDISEEDVLPFLGLILLHDIIQYKEGVVTLR